MSAETPQCPEGLYDPETDTLFRCINGPGQHEWHQDRFAVRWRDPMADIDLSQVDIPFNDRPATAEAELTRLFERLGPPDTTT